MIPRTNPQLNVEQARFLISAAKIALELGVDVAFGSKEEEDVLHETARSLSFATTAKRCRTPLWHGGVAARMPFVRLGALDFAWTAEFALQRRGAPSTSP